MKELTLQELKETELEILKMFDAFCKENNIKYYLSHGTLLGAIRYKKFIPWDDDVDLLIPREDYNRMLRLFKDSDRYQLFTFERDPNCSLPYTKLCDMSTRKVEVAHDDGSKLGVDIDLFPLDAWDDDLEKAKKEARYLLKNVNKLRLIRMEKPNTAHPLKKLKGWMILSYLKMRGSKPYIKKILRVSTNKKSKGSRYLGCKAWCVYGEKGIIPAEVFADTVDIEFEGMMFPAPIGWDTYLTCLYGDYLPEPPKDKQKSHHHFKAYRV